jgi:hypothetical protein
MLAILATLLKLGVSIAGVPSIFPHPKKAVANELQAIFPHCKGAETTFSLSPPLLKTIRLSGCPT